MTDKEKATLPDLDLTKLLESDAGDLLPEDIVRGVTPYRTAVNRIITGLVLTTFTLNIAALDYIGPAVGVILLAAGFRTIRNGNGFFKAGYVFSVCAVILTAGLLAVNATIYAPYFNGSAWSTAYGIIKLGFRLLIVICFWLGLKRAGHRFRITYRLNSGLLLCVWYAAVSVLGLMQVNSWLIFWVLIAAYILLLKSLVSLARDLERTGYTVSAAPVRISDRLYMGIIAAVFLLCVVFGYAFFHSYDMEWSRASKSAATKDAAFVREELGEKGFPDYVLSDMTDEDVMRCADSVKAYSKTSDFDVDGGRLQVTTVVAMDPEGVSDFDVIHSFRWLENPDHLYADGVKIYPAYSEPGFSKKNDISGRVLCERDGETLAADYHSLDDVTYEESDFMGTSMQTVIVGTYSVPDGSEGCRGYVLYSAGSDDPENYSHYVSGIHFAHQWIFSRYPHEDAKEALTASFMDDYSCFSIGSFFVNGTADGI